MTASMSGTIALIPARVSEGAGGAGGAASIVGMPMTLAGSAPPTLAIVW
jgi:hypothetical protein